MHLSVNQTYPWVLHLSDDELSVMQIVLRGDELDDDNESLADHLSHTLDKIRPLAARTRDRREQVREKIRDKRRTQVDTQVLRPLSNHDPVNDTRRVRLSST